MSAYQGGLDKEVTVLGDSIKSKRPVNKFLADHIRKQLLSRTVIGSYQHEVILSLSNEELIEKYEQNHEMKIQRRL